MLNHLLAKSGKRAMMLVSVLLLAMATFAVPAKPGLRRLLTLTDGTTVSATLVGDEHAHYWLGADGKAYQSAGDNVYQSVDLQAVKQHGVQRRAAANQRRTRRLAPRKVGEVGSITGQKKGLIILVNFTDVSFKAANNNALYQRIANEQNFSYGNFKGSMYDYFYAQSEGQFQLSFDVVGPVTVSKTQAYYGGNDSDGNDKYPATMVIEALKLVDSQVNFANYDWNGDGEVEQVYVVYAGQGEADGGADDTIWPHEYDLASAKTYGDGSGRQTLDNVKINTYACGGELNGNSNIAGIGTMCHEFSHCLGYPDFYDTDYSGGQGMFQWDLMDSGSYNDDGYQPAGYTSYERWVAGWKTPTELVNTQSITNMKALQDTGSDTYIIYNKANRNEYYLLENRQKTGWDTSLPGKGLLIIHVDYSSSAWSNNTPNDDPSHQRMTWVAADNQYQYTTYQGTKYYTETGAKNDPFPYGSVNAFGKNTTPAAKLYNKNSDNTYYLDSSVENITQNSDGTISFLFRGLSSVEAPTFSPNGGSFDYGTSVTVTISSSTTGASIYYTTDGSVPTTSSTLYSSALTFNSYTVLKAIAVKDGESSGVTEATYSFNEPIIVADESMTFSTYVGSPQTLPLNVLTENLTQNVTLTLTDPSNVFSLSSTSISKNVEETTVDVIFNPRTVGTFTGTIALSSTGAETVTVNLTATATEAPATNPNTKTFKLVNSASEMVSGMRYIIACGDQSVAAGALNSQILGSVETTFNDDITDITGKSVVVYVVEGNQSTGWTFKNESTNQYLYATTTKKLAESSAKNTWTLSGNETGVVMTYENYGTMLYNVSSPRFTTYTSSPTSTMVQAHLYMEYSGGTEPTSNTPTIVADKTLSFSTTVGDSQIKSFDVLAESLTENITVSLTDQNNVFSLGSTTITKSAAEDGATVSVTFTPTTDGTFTGTVTLTSTGANPVTVNLSGTAEAAATQTTSEEIIDFTAQGYSNQQTITSVSGNSCTISFGKGSNNNAPKYYTSGTAIRLYGSNTMTVSSTTKTIVGIELTFGTDDGSNTITTNVQTYNDGTWTGSASSVTFTIGGSSGNRRIQKVTVTYSDSGSGGGNNPGTDPSSSSDYYAKAKGKKGSALKTAMCEIIYPHTQKSYDYLWTAFQTTDVRSDGKIWDMYSNITNYVPGGSAQGANYSKEGDSYNREHSFPQSWFGEGNPMKTDLHHIYPTDGYVNSKRSNYPFGETNGGTDNSANNFSKLGTCTYPGYTGIVFEPAEEYKGDFARTYFYMVTCYENQLPSWYSSYSNSQAGLKATIDGTTYPALTTWQLEMLMKWSKNDPVSTKETARNEAVYGIQNNRNPFIDFPGLEEYIWGSMTATAFDDDNYVQPSSKENVTMAFSPTSATAILGESFTEPTLTTTPAGLSVAYSSDNTSVATVDASTGEVTLVAAGTTTITASFAGNDTYNGNSASYTLTVSTSQSGSSNDFALVTNASDFGEGDYLIVYDGGAMKALVSSNRLQYEEVTPLNNVITTSDATIIWHIAPSGNYYTIYNAEKSKYAASTGVANKAQLLSSSSDDKSLWSVSTGATFDFSNKHNAALSDVNYTLRRNGSYGFACYSTQTGGKLSLYKRTSSKVAPTWSTLPTDATVTVGQTYVLNLNNYVSGTPTPTISMTSAANASLTDGLFSFTPTAAGEHSFTFTATNSEGSANATLTVTVTLTAPTVPAGLALSEVTATSLTASWSAVNYADSYEIDIVKGSSFEASAGETVLTADFSSTTGWTLSGTGTYTGAGYYGAGSPSIKFDDTGDYAISPNFGSGSKLQFWAYGNNGSGSTFAISGLVNNSWTDIETVSIAQGSDTYEVNLPAGTSQVRFNFTKSVNCALDDVVVYGPSNSPESVDGYPKTVGNTSTSITGLTPETQYAVRVRAVNTAGNSDWSSIATATTTVANSAPVWSAFPANVNITVGEDYDLSISDYVSGIPTPTITMTPSGSNDADFDEGYFVFCPTEAGTFNFTFTATNSEGSANATLTVTVNQPPVTVPTLAVTEAAITATSAPVTWTACDGVASYTLQLASDNQFTTGGSGGAGETLTETFTNITFTTTGSSYTDQTISGGDLGTWTATSCRGDQGSPVIRYAGTLTSPTIANGVAAVEFDYDWPFSESGSCDIELYVGGTLMGTATVTGGTAGTATYTLDSPVSGPTTIEFLNKASSNKRMRVTKVRITSPSSGSFGSGSLIAEYTVNGTEYTFTGLDPETTYYARVKGNAGWSNVEQFETEALETITLANASDNTSVIESNNGKWVNVTLADRTLWKDGDWNTLCLPFDMSAEQIAASVLAGADIRALTSAEFNAGTLTLNFTPETGDDAVKAITAGTPYLIKWAGNGTDNIVNPTFSGVTIDKTVRNKTCELGDGKSITFCGTYSYRQFTEIDKSILFFGTNSTLYYPQNGATIAAQRAYFTLEGITAGDPTNPSNPIKGFVINFGDETETCIVSMDNGQWTMDNEAGAWYTIDGRRVNTPSLGEGRGGLVPGIYIHNGRKVVIK